jgi:PAS domain S-box-containing protein
MNILLLLFYLEVSHYVASWRFKRGGLAMVEVQQKREQIDVSCVISTLLNEFSAVTDYRTMQDSLPRRLASLLHCRYVLCYQRMAETLQFVAGSSGDSPGWSSALLAVAHINPIAITGDVPEAHAWRERRLIAQPVHQPTQVAAPLIYRQRTIGVMVLVRGLDDAHPGDMTHWWQEEMGAIEAVAGVVALLLENTHLLERDRERIHELSLLNTISSQVNNCMYDPERLRNSVVQHARDISSVDRCEMITATSVPGAISWISPSLQEMLIKRFREQSEPVPLVLERPGNHVSSQDNAYLSQLSADIKTFFAVPLVSGHLASKGVGGLLRGSLNCSWERDHEQKVLGIIVGAYGRTWKLRQAEMILLRVLAGQASAVLENMHLMTEVIEARNEARKLLRQVLDDQRMKELILENMPSGLITTDRQGHITTFNRAATAILGYQVRDALGQPLLKLLSLHVMPSSTDVSITSQPPLHPVARALKAVACDDHDETVHSETIVTVDCRGREVVLDLALLPLSDDTGKYIGILATFTDVTSVHRLEEEKRRLDRLATLGEMAANVAHEVRNPLASIKTSMQMLKDDIVFNELPIVDELSEEKQAHWVQESIDVVLKEVERLDTIVRDLLLFARPRQLHRVKCYLVELSDHVLQLLQQQCIEARVIMHRLYKNVPPVHVDAAQMEQVLFNLFMNAIQAMPDGGILTVTCHVVSAEPGDEVPHWVELMVSDTGVGLTPEQMERMFQPFFTTKAHGIGLGLAITRRLIEDHGGSIHVQGSYGAGATISLRLPVVTDGGGEESGDGGE